jgi:PAS domain S-box-containing protein
MSDRRREGRVPGTAPDETGRGPRKGLARRAAWLPIPFFLAALAVLWRANLQTPYESAGLLLAFNLVFSVLVCLFIAYLVGRSFLARSAPGLLLLGCGVLIWGAAGFVGVVAGLAAAGGRLHVSVLVSIHNSCAWLSGLCHLTGVGLSRRPRRALAPAGAWLGAGYALALGAVALVVVASLAGWMPTFFVQGRGGTPLRYAVLGSALGMFALTALLLRAADRRSPSAFAYWYSLGLGLIAVGVFGIMIETVHGGVLSWAGRAPQFLSGVYLLAAAIASARETHAWRIPLEEALRQTEAELREAQRVARVGNWYWDLASDAVSASEQTYRMLGLDPALPIAVLREREWQLYTPESQVQVRGAVQEAIQSGGSYTLDVEARRADGTPLWLTARAEAVRDANGRIIALRGINQDITERKQAERERERLQKGLLAAERARAEIAEQLSDEVAHRVKNNLAMVSGLLQMQMLGETDPRTAAALREAVGRIRAFAALHEQMYDSDSDGADLLLALQRIGAATEALFAGRGDTDIRVDGEPFWCSARVVTNLSVIANELITNALKHGGPGRDGRHMVAVSLCCAGNGPMLSVWNSGTPIRGDFDPGRARTMGLRLVHDLVVEQYQGLFRLSPFDGGTLAEVVVPGEAVRADALPR